MKPLDDHTIKEILDARQDTRRRPLAIVGTVLRAIVQAAIAVAILAGGYQVVQRMIASKASIPTRPPVERVYPIETIAVQPADHRPEIRAYGQVTAGRTVELRALVAGTVTEILPGLRSGTAVPAGEVLVRIDEFEYAGALTGAHADLAEAEARHVEMKARLALERDALGRAREQLIFAERDLERASQLRERGRLTDREFDERKLLVSEREQAVEQRLNNVRISEAGVHQQEAALARLEWGVEDAKRDLSETALRAPFNGIVLLENVEVGRVLNENDIAVSMYEADSLEVRFQLTDRDYGDLLADGGTIVGRTVEVFWHVGDVPVVVPGEILRAGAEIVADRGGIEVFARLDMSGLAEPIRTGAFVEILVPGRLYAGTYELPESSVYDNDHVFVSVDGRLQRRDVRVLAFGDETVIVTGALQPEDRVLATRIAEIGEGLKIRDVGSKSENEGAPGDAESPAPEREG